jgi:hypothetical protein
MDGTEALIREHLELRGFSDIVFEPDGNIPPDFLIDGRIAVEARRLNQSFESGGKLRGLEETSYPLYGKIRSLLESLGPPRSGTSWFVLHQFNRPIPPWAELEAKIKDCCTEVAQRISAPPGTHLEAKIHPNFELSFLRASEAHDALFLMGGFSDYDAGGWVRVEMEKNIQHCIDEKTAKTQAHRHRYSEWWLALVDYIGYGLSQQDQEDFKSSNRLVHSWDKIVIVSPMNPNKWFEI